jgi:predicted ribosomally synthesized peptide with nif11-like leader
MSIRHVKAFIEQLGNDESLRCELATLPGRDWEGVVRIAAKAGFVFTVVELIKQLPEGFYRGHGIHPELGWDKQTQLRK